MTEEHQRQAIWDDTESELQICSNINASQGRVEKSCKCKIDKIGKIITFAHKR